MLEKDIEEWLGKQLEKLGCLSFKFVSPGNPGVPDRIYILPDGEVWFVELKQQLGRMSHIQVWQRDRMIAHGCNYLLVRGMPDARRFVEERKREIYTASVSGLCNTKN